MHHSYREPTTIEDIVNHLVVELPSSHPCKCRVSDACQGKTVNGALCELGVARIIYMVGDDQTRVQHFHLLPPINFLSYLARSQMGWFVRA